MTCRDSSDGFTFRGSSDSDSLHRAIDTLAGLYMSGARKLPEDAPTSFVPQRWIDQVWTGDGELDRYGWEMCVLCELGDGLRGANVSVEHGRRYQDPAEHLSNPSHKPTEPIINQARSGRCIAPSDTEHSTLTYRRLLGGCDVAVAPRPVAAGGSDEAQLNVFTICVKDAPHLSDLPVLESHEKHLPDIDRLTSCGVALILARLDGRHAHVQSNMVTVVDDMTDLEVDVGE
jgi:hypothetical protein